MIGYIDIALALYFICLSFITTTENAKSAFLFKFMPFVGGCVFLLHGAIELNFVVLNF